MMNQHTVMKLTVTTEEHMRTILAPFQIDSAFRHDPGAARVSNGQGLFKLSTYFLSQE